ncbi:MAG: hypothetical protein IT560_10785 [Alphaproteobacteria bacterium]|nr:hypothetical protein [Alphaproteobacteria bacterium]
MKAVIATLKKPMIFAIAWPFAAWIIFSIIGARIIGGTSLKLDTPAEPDIIGGFEVGAFGYKVMFLTQFLPGALAMMFIKREIISNIFGVVAYLIYSALIFFIFFFVLHGKIPNVFILLDA